MGEENVQKAELLLDIPLEDVINNTLVKGNVTDKVINELTDRYGSMVLKSLDDHEGYNAIKEARKEVRKIGIITEKLCEKGRSDALKTQRLWVSKEKETLARIAKVQGPLDDEIKKYEDEKERLAIAEKERKAQLFIERQSMLLKKGADYSGGKFILDHLEYSATDIESADVEVWEKIILPKYHEQYEIKEKDKVAAEEKRKQEAAQLKEQQEQFALQQKELREQQEAINKQRQELDNKEKERKDSIIKNRGNQLQALGMKFNFEYDSYVYEDVNIDNKTELCLLESEEWNTLINKITPVIAERKKAADEKKLQQEEDQRKKDAEKTTGTFRYGVLKEIGFDNQSIEVLGPMPEGDWNKLYGNYKEQYETKKKQQWQEEQQTKADQEAREKAETDAQATDKQKWEKLLSSYSAIVIPAFKSSHYKSKATLLKSKVDEIIKL